jgi:predicted nucleic acid-binding protein/catechol 2,3-dioxygenase-like lactoylglutathione lyase family enzyme
VSGFLLDTNVLSEFSGTGPPELLCASVLFIAEIRRGIAGFTGHPKHRCEMAIMSAAAQRRGLRVAVIDGLIAATALEYGLTVVTRKVKDFAGTSGPLYNPRMQRIPWSTLALGSLLLVSAAWNAVQALQAPAKTEPRGRIGGVFFKSPNGSQTRDWYSKHLGITDKGGGAMLPWREHDDPQKEHVTLWTVFPASTTYFPAAQPFMMNYIVDDMDALLDRLKQEGVKIDDKRMNEAYGRFAWIYDPDGNKIELWQPAAKP